MPHATRATRFPPPESFTATVSLHGEKFAFRLFTRPLSLGPSLSIQYYWMDSSGFRIARGRRAMDPVNYRNCVGHWWRAMRLGGLGRDPVQIRHLLLATSFALVSRGNSLQHVYRDAYLAPGATTPQRQSLPDAVRQGIQAVIRSRDRERVRHELEALLGVPDGSDAGAEVLRQAFNGILGHGVDLFQQHGMEGLHEFLGKFDAWCGKHRKKGRQDWLRRFLNLMAYECKVCFFRCYSNAWIDIIPWLQQHRGLDEVSERFLRFWHMQNQPLELPNGHVIPDVFCGQVLSLHPLSGFFMKDAALCAIAGQFFGSDAYDQVIQQGRALSCAAYWDLVGAILTATHLYRQALEEQEQRRGVRQVNRNDPSVAHVAAAPCSEEGLLEEFINANGYRCAQCGAVFRLNQYYPAAAAANSFAADVRCADHGHESRLTIERADLERWLSRED